MKNRNTFFNEAPPLIDQRQVDLSKDVLFEIFKHLSITDLAAVSAVSVAWRHAANDDGLWRSVLNKNAGFCDGENLENAKDIKRTLGFIKSRSALKKHRSTLQVERERIAKTLNQLQLDLEKSCDVQRKHSSSAISQLTPLPSHSFMDSIMAFFQALSYSSDIKKLKAKYALKDNELKETDRKIIALTQKISL